MKSGSNKKIYLLINSLMTGGSERQVSLLLKHLPVEKVILLEDDVAYPADRSKLVILSKFKVRTPLLIKTLYIPVYSMLLARLIGQGSIVISFLERSNFVNVLAKILFKKHKAVISERTNPQQQYANKGLAGSIYKKIIKFFYEKSDRLVVNSPLQPGFFSGQLPVQLIPNSYDINIIRKQSQEKLDKADQELFRKHRIIISSGRLTEAKGHWHMIRSFAYLKEKIKNIKLVIIGDGELKKDIVSLIRSWKLENDVILSGYQENPFKYIARADLFILHSIWESMPNMLLEAMICKVPVIAALCSSGIADVLDKDPDLSVVSIYRAKYGIIIPGFPNRPVQWRKLAVEPVLQNEQVLGDAVIQMLMDKKGARQYREKAFQRAMDFSIHKITGQYKKLISQV